MNAKSKGIAQMLFGDCKGLQFNLKNLIYAAKNISNYKLINTSLNGPKFIKIRSLDLIEYSISVNNEWVDYKVSICDFWDVTKVYKKYMCILEERP